MKVIKDAFMKWLNEELYKEATDQPTPARSRYDVLLEVKEKLQQVINEEFDKLSQQDDEESLDA